MEQGKTVGVVLVTLFVILMGYLLIFWWTEDSWYLSPTERHKLYQSVYQSSPHLTGSSAINYSTWQANLSTKVSKLNELGKQTYSLSPQWILTLSGAPYISTQSSETLEKIINFRISTKSINADGKLIWNVLYLKHEVPFDAQYIKNAEVFASRNQEYVVILHFNTEGAQYLRLVTERYHWQQLGIFKGDVLLTAPTIQGQIDDGKMILSGAWSEYTASNLAKDINLSIENTIRK